MNTAAFSPEQRSVVDVVARGGGRYAVLGGPGTGKTTTALWAARSYLDRHNGPARSRVLFLTFSRSAVDQIARRSSATIGPYEDRIEIMTFHALAYRLIRAFGRYGGHGIVEPSIQTQASEKLFGRGTGALSYDELMPMATELLRQSKRVNRLVQNRWDVVICDEAQDTSQDQWELLRMISHGVMVLLGDPHQMIYAFRDGVSPRHFDAMLEQVDRTIDLGTTSFRDPSRLVPALADAVRRRDFTSEAVTTAIRKGRLRVHANVAEENIAPLVGDIVGEAFRSGSRDVNVLTHGNAAVAALADELRTAGIDCAVAGLPEAHAMGLNCLATLCRFGAGLATDDEVRHALALFLTAQTRGKWAPETALALIGRGTLQPQIDSAIRGVETALVASAGGDVGRLAETAAETWDALRIVSGLQAWERAVQHFRRLTAGLWDRGVGEEAVAALEVVVRRNVEETLIDVRYEGQERVKLMTYHQAKGREADVVIHVFRDDDYFGNAGEPYEETSRVLNVAISRARKLVEIVLPESPHPVVEPFRRVSRQQPSDSMNAPR